MTNFAEHSVSDIERRLRVLALATEWGVSQGGVSAWNLEFCRALVRAGHHVTCGLVSELGRTLEDTSDTPVPTVLAPFGPPRSLIKDEFDLIIGHGLHTGPHARYYREEYFSTARYVHVQHVDHVIEHDKLGTPITKVDEKEARSRGLLAAADFVVGVGPRLTRTASRLLLSSSAPAGKAKPIRLDPGVPSHLLHAQPRSPDRENTGYLLVVGRADDWHLKGFDIAAEAAAKLPPRKIQNLRIRGVRNEGREELKSTLMKLIGQRELQLDLRPFEKPDVVLSDLLEADCVLLPSRREGFGLSAFESLCLGVPTLVTSNSGLADLLVEKCPDISEKIVVSSLDPQVWANRIEWAISPENLDLFLEVRRVLTTSCLWEHAVSKLMNSALGSIPAGAA